MTKIAFYCGAFKKDFDGATKTIHRLLKDVESEGYIINIWTYEDKPDTDFVTHRISSCPLFFAPGYRLALPSKKIITGLEKFSPDIIHLTVPDLVGSQILHYAKKKKIPVVASFHTDFIAYLKYFRLNWLSGVLKKWLVKFYRSCSLVFVPSKYVYRQLALWGLTNICFWGRGIDHDYFNPGFYSADLRRFLKAEEKKIILFVGRLVAYKGLEVLCAVYSLLKEKKRDKDVVFLVVGDGPLRKKLAKKLPDVFFMGKVNGLLLSEIYATADIFLFPSDSETFGNVIIEAMASGLPAIVADRGGCRELVEDSQAGIVCRSGDASDFCQALEKLLCDENLYQIMRINGLNYAQKLDWSKVNRIVPERYRSLLEKTNCSFFPALLKKTLEKI